MKKPFKSFGSVIKCIRFYWSSYHVVEKKICVNSSVCSITFDKEFDPLKKAFLSKVFEGRLNAYLFEYSYITNSLSKLIVHLKY